MLYEDKTVIVSVDTDVERMTLEHNSWRFRLAPSVFFGGAGQVAERRRECCGKTGRNKTNGNINNNCIHNDSLCIDSLCIAYTACSMIAYWHDTVVCVSVCLSVCL